MKTVEMENIEYLDCLGSDRNSIAYKDAQGRLDRAVMNALMGSRSAGEELICIRKVGKLDHSRLVQVMKGQPTFSIDTLICLRSLVRVGEKLPDYRVFPKPKVLSLTGMNDFVSRLSIEDGGRMLLWIQSLVEGSISYEPEIGQWEPTRELLKNGIRMNHRLRQSTRDYLGGRISLSDADYNLLKSNRGTCTKEPNPLLGKAVEELLK